MANNIILAVPSANSSVNYELPQSESAKLSFTPEDINGIQLDPNGGLVISFVEGGQVTLSNFQGFIDNGNTLSLADGTQVDPKLLFNALGGEATAPLNAADDAIKIEIPAANAHNEITLEPGQKYLMNFDLTETSGANVKDGKMIVDFANGGKITIANYETAMANATPPELSLAAKTCVVTGDELITNIQQLAKSGVVEETIVAEEVIEEVKPKSKIAAADMESKQDIGPGDETDLSYKVAKVEPAAGELAEADIARQLAEIETAAGGAAPAGRAGGYGYGSRPGSDPFTGKPDIGPIDPTALGYRAPTLSPSRHIDVDKDTSPIAIQPGAKFVDETNFDSGPLVVSGSLNIDYGADGPGGVTSNGSFSSGGSQTNSQLSSNGQPVTVKIVGNDYVATTPDGTVVFKLEVNPANGDYRYTQYETLDHADGSNPNDQITLNFGVTARDGDGDAISTTIQIVVADDAPEIKGDEKTIDETDLGPIVVTNKLVHDFNADGPGRIETTGSFTSSGSQKNGVLTSSGVPVVVSATPNGYEGKANGVTVFTLTLNPATGEYTYTQFKNLDHADASNPNDIITLTFGAKITDYDGDTATAPIVIHIKDDAPIFQPPGDPNDPNGGIKPDKGLEIVDETNLKNGPAVETGRLDADFGSDTPGSYAFKSDSFTSSGSKTNGQLTHNGIPVVVTLVNGVWVGKAGDTLIFKLELNTSTGDYKFTLYDNLDHADKSNPDDQIVLDFGVAAADYDGDRADGSIRIIVKDDGPIANDDSNTYDTTFGVANGNVVTGLNGGPGAADNLSTDGWTATDNSNKVVKIAFGDKEIDVPETGTVSIDGEYGTLTIQSDGTYTYKAFDNGGMVTPGSEKQFSSGPALPDFDESEALDGVEQQSLGVAPGNLTLNGGETVTVTFKSEQAGYGNTMGVFTVGPDGKLKAETVLIKDGNAASQGQSFTYAAGSDAKSLGFFIVADGSTINNGYPGIDFSKGSLNFVYDYGTGGAREATISDDGSKVKLVYTSDAGVETVIQGPLYFTSDRGGSENLNADGSVRVVSGIPGDDNTVLTIGFEDLPCLGDKDYNDIVFNVEIKGKDCGCGDPDIKDQFVYTLQDGDGDKDKATLTLNGKDLTDDVPAIVQPAAKTVDETSLKDGALTEGGKIIVDFGHDGPGTIAANGSFNSSGSQTNNALSHKGVPVAVTLVGDTYVGKAGNTTVFTMQIKADGTYSFKQFKPLDHADGNNPNDIISLEFGAQATDCDGDKSFTKVVINVKDDAPVAHNDSNSVGEGSTVTGNVLTNDVVGQDSPGTLLQVAYKDMIFIVPANGTVTIPGQYGTLTIDKTGAYSYTARSDNPNGKDEFSYILKDSDGDRATACLVIDVTCVDDVPVITPSVKTVDESNLSGGVVTETGTISVNYGGDGPGKVTGNGSFNSSGSQANNALTHNGVPVKVSLNGNTYEGKAGNTTVFTLTIEADGKYTFKLLEQLDHADGNNPNDIISLNFGVTATDADGDAIQSKITINVKDDAPVAQNDSNSAGEGQTVKGNVITNDTVGQDSPGTITKVTIGGKEYTVPANGSVTIPGQYGTLTIDKTGAYSYTARSDNPNGKDQFVYTLKDSDGDQATACLTIDVTCVDDQPVIKPAVETVDETNLSGGVITETGAVTVSYGNDGPGAVTGNGSFTSGGSKAGGQLTSNGVPVSVAFNPTTNTYEGKAGGTTIFTLVVAANGSYTFKLLEQLDHADGNNPNDIINLNFGVVATDADGDKSTATITVNVKDDAPIANDDGRQVAAGQSTINGNVTDNDVVGQDVKGSVTQIAFGDMIRTIPASGSVSITGNYGTLTIDHTGAYTYVAKPGAAGVDNFSYILKDNDGDRDDACLSIEVKENPIVVCITAEDVCVKEDGNVNLPVNAYFQNGSGNETMTITLTGVPAGWTVTSPGWTLAGGVYTLVLGQGVRSWDGALNFKPPANSDVDLNGLVFKASVYDPDTNSTKTATDGANVIVDAVIDPFKFSASLTDNPSAPGSGKIFVMTQERHIHHAKLNIANLTHNDTDGSESLKRIVFTVADPMDNTAYITVKNADGTFSQIGTKGSSGNDTTYTIDLSGMTYEQAKDFITNKLYLTDKGNSGLGSSYNLGIQIVKYEKNLSGIEKDYSDNETSYTVCLPVMYCISPLVIDLDRDGVELLSYEHGVLFDITNDGIKDQTGWAAKDDALLALDKNGDGIINDRSELFGNTEDHANGFANLAAYDLNGDGIIDAKDAVYKDLKVWQDSNSDGISQAHEMKSLSDVGIAAIKLGAQEVSYEIAGNPISHESTVVYTDGSTSAIVDAWFAYNDGASAGVDKGLTLHGTDGNDVLSGGSGNDELYGGAGADTFLFQTISEGVDTLKDFNAAEGDKIDLSNVLSNFDPLTDAINDFVFATATDDGKTILSVNVDGSGAAAAHQFAVIDSGNVNVSDLFNNGSIVV